MDRAVGSSLTRLAAEFATSRVSNYSHVLIWYSHVLRHIVGPELEANLTSSSHGTYITLTLESTTADSLTYTINHGQRNFIKLRRMSLLSRNVRDASVTGFPC